MIITVYYHQNLTHYLSRQLYDIPCISHIPGNKNPTKKKYMPMDY